MDGVATDEEDYLKPASPAAYENPVYLEPSEPQGTDGNTAYIEIFDNYHDYNK